MSVWNEVIGILNHPETHVDTRAFRRILRELYDRHCDAPINEREQFAYMDGFAAGQTAATDERQITNFGGKK